MKSNKYEELVGKLWYPIMKPFFESDEFKQIVNTLKEYKNKGLKVQPDFTNTFSILRNCPLTELKVVMLMEIGTNKADNDKIADTIALAIHDDTKSSPSNIWKTTNVLLLPLNLTAVNNENHKELWKPFIFHIMKALQSKPGIIYCFIGKSSKSHWMAVNDTCNDKYYIEHPMQAIANNRKWKHENVFQKINRVSTFLNEKTIW